METNYKAPQEKAVLISINPKWCDLIFNGEKTMEVRKSFPKLDAPFRAIVYCTKAKTTNDNFWVTDETGYNWLGNGKVIGEFICNGGTDLREIGGTEFFKRSCMTYDDWRNYTDYTKHIIWGWDVEKPTLYEKPRELSEFLKPCIMPEMPYCPCCEVGYEYISETEAEFYRVDGECSTEWVCLNYVKHPPQSWCYIKNTTAKAERK